MAGFEVTPLRPSSSRSFFNLPDRVRSRLSRSSQTDCPNSSSLRNRLFAIVVSPPLYRAPVRAGGSSFLLEPGKLRQHSGVSADAILRALREIPGAGAAGAEPAPRPS